jgi:hypothetical protein
LDIFRRIVFAVHPQKNNAEHPLFLREEGERVVKERGRSGMYLLTPNFRALSPFPAREGGNKGGMGE